ncbi:hypothetical protein JOQ06_016269 [Pogonophryne albipinna]|uniref:Protein kinase domain-containing protein n=1 Tax=Pogonophryne albipinna TaxID=1090488 RepID=A0AAD6FA68_9TELE|nr:hypothetical protein JOQ06_008559 [Pogonophryne albipinna]KAJ4928477.1 hypothetical protein JOQ06_016269 [Pogonophryne albipinna]
MLSKKKHQPLIDTISENYQILKVLGAGCYGQVVECLKLDTEETVAVKVLKQKNSSKNNMREVLILERLQCFDPDKSHIVRCHECFQSIDRTFLVFEMLDMSLHDYMNKRRRLPLPLKGIQMMIRDLATALDTLKGIGIIHSDLKMDNVMLVNHHVKPFRVKLIDFGLAVKISEVWPGVVMQLFGIGPLKSFLACHLMRPLTFGRHEYDVLRYIIDLLGEPPKELLNRAVNTGLFFKEKRKPFVKKHWTFKTPKEFQRETLMKTREDRAYSFSSLEALKKTRLHKANSPELEDRTECVELLKEMLTMHQNNRITPEKILVHPFTIRRYLSRKDCPKPSSHCEPSTLKELPPGFTEVQMDERTLEVGEAPKESSAISTQAVQGEIEQEWKLESISNEDWEIEIIESVMASDNTKAPSSSSEESLSSPVISQPRKGIRGFFSKMKRNFCL